MGKVIIHFSNGLQAAFTCIKNLWNRKPLKVYGGRMAESMLAILCHILRGEPVIRERLSKEKEGSRGEEEAGQEEGGSRREPQVNQQQLQQVECSDSTLSPYI
jgi:E3 ubiquitin-protein ligase HUWE1